MDQGCKASASKKETSCPSWSASDNTLQGLDASTAVILTLLIMSYNTGIIHHLASVSISLLLSLAIVFDLFLRIPCHRCLTKMGLVRGDGCRLNQARSTATPRPDQGQRTGGQLGIAQIRKAPAFQGKQECTKNGPWMQRDRARRCVLKEGTDRENRSLPAGFQPPQMIRKSAPLPRAQELAALKNRDCDCRQVFFACVRGAGSMLVGRDAFPGIREPVLHTACTPDDSQRVSR